MYVIELGTSVNMMENAAHPPEAARSGRDLSITASVMVEVVVADEEAIIITVTIMNTLQEALGRLLLKEQTTIR